MILRLLIIWHGDTNQGKIIRVYANRNTQTGDRNK